MHLSQRVVQDFTRTLLWYMSPSDTSSAAVDRADAPAVLLDAGDQHLDAVALIEELLQDSSKCESADMQAGSSDACQDG